MTHSAWEAEGHRAAEAILSWLLKDKEEFPGWGRGEKGRKNAPDTAEP